MKMSTMPACFRMYALRDKATLPACERTRPVQRICRVFGPAAARFILHCKIMRARMSESVLDMATACFLFITCKCCWEPRTVPDAAISLPQTT